MFAFGRAPRAAGTTGRPGGFEQEAGGSVGIERWRAPGARCYGAEQVEHPPGIAPPLELAPRDGKVDRHTHPQATHRQTRQGGPSSEAAGAH